MLKRIPVLLLAVMPLLDLPFAKADQFWPDRRSGSVVNVADFGVKPNTGDDATFGVLLALDACRAVKNPVY
jgi:hypothetical protein